MARAALRHHSAGTSSVTMMKWVVLILFLAEGQILSPPVVFRLPLLNGLAYGFKTFGLSSKLIYAS